jgi:hypothetical protein
MAVLLAGRSRFNAAYRLMIRFQQVADLAGGARTRRWRAVAALSAAGDIALIGALKRSGRSLYRQRLILDAVDQAVWSTAPYPEAWDFAVLPGVPLAFEVGGERGAVGFGVPLLNFVATVPARWAVGRRTSPVHFLWQAAAVVTGMAFTRLDRATRRSAIEHELRRRQAECDRATLAGQHSVAVGTANALDRLRRVAVLLDDVRADSPVRQLCDTWRTSLGERTREQAAYLREVLLRHEQRRDMVPHLAAHVRFEVGEDTGTTLLSPQQADELAATLDGLGLRGIVPVSIGPRPVRWRPGMALPLDLGPHRFVLPADRSRRRRSPDVAPIALVLNAIWFGRTTARVAEAVPWRVAGSSIGVSLATAAWAHRFLDRNGADGRGPVLAAAFAVSLWHNVVGSATMRRPITEYGKQNSILYATVTAPGVIGSYQYDSLPARYRALLPLGVAALGATALAFTPRPVRWGQFAAALAWSLGSLVPGLDVERAFQRVVEPEVRNLRVDTDAAAAAAFDAGRRAVLTMVADALDDARHQLDRRRAALNPQLIAEVDQSLSEVERVLADIEVTPR